MPQPLVALSIGNSEDLEDLGFGVEHLDDFTLRLAKKLLAWGVRLAYGGVLGPDLEAGKAQDSFVHVLLDIISEEGVRDRDNPPLVNPQPWPWHENVPTDVKAKYRGVIQFIGVDPAPGVATVEMTDDRFPWALASACTEMRLAMTRGIPTARPPVPPCGARVVLGGKRSNWAGILPGIAEEVLYMLEANRPVYVLGGYGGCAKLIADYVSGEADELPAELTLAGHQGSPKLAAVRTHAPSNTVESAFERLDDALTAVRTDLGRLNNGLDSADNKLLMKSENARRIGQLLVRGLRAAGVVTAP